MSRERFAITRPDGRSHADLIVALVSGAAPGHRIPYAELVACLSYDAHQYTIRRVQDIVRQSARQVSVRAERVLRVVRLYGYEVAPANAHVGLALVRRSRADVQMRRGVDILRHVKWDEMTPNERAAHEGQLLVASAIYQQMQAVMRRQRGVDEALANLTRRVEVVERGRALNHTE